MCSMGGSGARCRGFSCQAWGLQVPIIGVSGAHIYLLSTPPCLGGQRGAHALEVHRAGGSLITSTRATMGA